MKITLKEVQFAFANAYGEYSLINGLKTVALEMYQNYAERNFNLIGEYSNLYEASDYVEFKCRDLLWKFEPIIKANFPSTIDFLSVLLSDYKADNETISINENEQSSSNGYNQNENSPMNSNIEDIQTPIYKSASKVGGERSFNKTDTHTYNRIDDLIKKYEFINTKEYAILSRFIETNLICPLIDEMNTIY